MRKMIRKSKISIFLLLLFCSYTYAAFNSNEIEPQPGWGVTGSSLAWADYDNDGDLDIAIAGHDGTAYRLRVYRNNGNGTFNPTPVEPQPGWGVSDCSIAWGDYDNDGDPDLAVAGHDGTVKRFRIYRNNGNGTFNSTPVEPEPGWGVSSDPCSVAWCDYDNDGDLDIAVAGIDTGVVFVCRIYINNGDGTFDPNEIEPQPGRGYRDCSIAWGDIDNDGDQDIAIGGHEGMGPTLQAYTNLGDGTFSSNRIYIGPGTLCCSIAWADFDNDNDLDLGLGGYSGAYQLAVHVNNGNGTFSSTVEPEDPGYGIRWGGIAWGDYDNDGDLDLATTGISNQITPNPRLRIYNNNGDGTFNSTEVLVDGTWGVYYGTLAWADFDNDGDLDLAVTGNDGTAPCFRVYENLEAVVNSAPSEPGSLSAVCTNGYWTFKWAHSTDDHTPQNLLGYNIAIGTNQTGQYDYFSDIINYPQGQANAGNVPNGSTSGSSCFYQSQIPFNKNVFWKVCAIDNCYKASAYTSEESDQYIPVILNTVAVSSTQINIFWQDDLSNETSYTLYQNTVNNPNTAPIKISFSPNTVNYSAVNLNPSTTYYYWIKVCTSEGASDFSASGSATTASVDTPTISDCYPLSQQIICLEWNDVSGEESYYIYRSIDSIIDASDFITTVTQNITIFTDQGLEPGVTYHYKVRANDNGSLSAYSLIADAETYYIYSQINNPINKGYLGRYETIMGEAESTGYELSCIQMRLKSLNKNMFWNEATWVKETNTWFNVKGTKDWQFQTKNVPFFYGNEYQIETRAFSLNNEQELDSNKISFIAVYSKDKKGSYVNYPNPFNPIIESTVIEYFLESNIKNEIIIYDIKGEKVKEYNHQLGQPGGEKGVNRITWDGKNTQGDYIANGIYFCYLKTSSYQAMTKIMVVK